MRVFFALPCYGQQLSMHTSGAMNHTILELACRGIMPAWSYQSAVLPHVRNMLMLTYITNTDADYLFWIDTDIGFKPRDVLSMLKLDVDIAVANYVKKQPDRESTILKNGEWLKVDDLMEPMEIDSAGMGFVCVKRHVIQKLYDEAPKSSGIPLIVETGIVNGVHCETEDHSFFVKARAAGYKTILDPTVKLVHFGVHAYT